jgi:hypothetical protein
VYVAVKLSEPAASEPAGILIVADVATSDAGDDVYPPPVIVTVPVTVGAPPPPLTATVTVSPCSVVMLEDEGVTVTAGDALETVTPEEVPVAPL